MSSSTEARPETGTFEGTTHASIRIDAATVLRGAGAAAASAIGTPELRSGAWTRLGDSSVLGDTVTEQVLSDLAETTRRAARSQGYAVGWAEGRREAALEAQLVADQVAEEQRRAEERREAEHRTAVAALARAGADLQQALATLTTGVEDHALALAGELTEALVGHELRYAPDLGADVVRRVLAVLPDGVPVTVRLHPAAAGSAAAQELSTVGLRVVADPSLELGDAVVEADDHVIDLAVSSALARVREVLA